jgi:ADP-heptose:LPS heptosyltransferase
LSFQDIAIQAPVNLPFEYGLDDKVIDLTKDLNSFDDTASLVQQMDLVITSDTSVAHLAGGLGVELWVLLTKYPDWKWENKGDSSYWYNNTTLFRQKTSMIWEASKSMHHHQVHRFCIEQWLTLRDAKKLSKFLR